MRHTVLGLAIGILSCAGAEKAFSQAAPTATAPLQISAFGGVTGTYTGVGLGRNLSITAGLDVTFRSFYSIYPSVEVRGTYPVDKGSVDGQRNILGGVVLGKHIGRIQPYGDFLIGQGQIDYSPSYPNPNDTILYQQTVSPVYGPGGGANLLMTDRLGFKGDFQFQHYATPVSASGAVYSKAFTLGLIYRFRLGGRGPR